MKTIIILLFALSAHAQMPDSVFVKMVNYKDSVQKAQRHRYDSVQKVKTFKHPVSKPKKPITKPKHQ